MARNPETRDEKPLHGDEQPAASLRDKLASMGQAERDEASTSTHLPQPVPQSDSAGPNLQSRIAFGKPSLLDLAIFCRQFSTLIGVGIPVLRALRMLSERTPHPKLRRAVAQTAEDVEGGQAIHAAMDRHSHIFSPLVVNIVRVGELGGIIESSLLRLAEMMESKAKIKRQVVSASMYPLVALGVAILMIMLIMAYAIPRFAEMYDQVGNAELPAITQLVIALSGFFASAWWLVLILIVGLLIGARIWITTPLGPPLLLLVRAQYPHPRARQPQDRRCPIQPHHGRSRHGRIPSRRSHSPSPPRPAKTPWWATPCTTSTPRSNAANAWPSPLHDSGVFPEIVVDMIAIGEETGTLDQMLDKIADTYEDDVEATLAGLTTIIEPLLIVVLGGVVIFIALAALYPYFNLASIVGE